jgi:hypothetical protein
MFYASPVLMSGSSIGTEIRFGFVQDTYKVLLKRSFYDSTWSVIEKGHYVIHNSTVSATEECKLVCKYTFTEEEDVPCGRFGTAYENGFFVCSASISDETLQQLRFRKYEFIMNRNKGKIILTDKANPNWKLLEIRK